MEPGRVARDLVLLCPIGDELDCLRRVRGHRPKARCRRHLSLAEGQHIAARLAAVERHALAVSERMPIPRRADRVAVLAELGDRRPLEDLLAPITDVIEVHPVRRARMGEVAPNDQGVGCPSAGTEAGRVCAEVAEQAVEAVRQCLLGRRHRRRVRSVDRRLEHLQEYELMLVGQRVDDRLDREREMSLGKDFGEAAGRSSRRAGLMKIGAEWLSEQALPQLLGF